MAEDIELQKLKLEERRFEEELQIKKKELELREKELEFQLKQSEEAQKSKGFFTQTFTPFGIAVIAAFFGFFGTVYNACNTAKIEKERADNEKQLETLKSKSAVFLKWYEISQKNDSDTRAKDLLNLKDLRYLDLPEDYERRLRENIGLRQDDKVPPPGVTTKIFLLSGKKSDDQALEDIRNQLIPLGYNISGKKFLIDDSRPITPEIRYYNAVDQQQAIKIKQVLQTNYPNIAVTITADSSATPGYLEIWLGR